MAAFSTKPSFVVHKDHRFLLIDVPTDANMEAYVREFAAHDVSQLVRACECSYNTDKIRAAGITVHDLPFPDGEAPPDSVIRSWLAVCDDAFAGGNPDKRAVAVHCIAGLGRTAVLVSIALIEAGMEPLEAVKLIREKRRGAINAKQLRYLEGYTRRGGGCCTVQ